MHNDSMELFTDANGIRTEWNGHFKKLYQSGISEKYDNEFRNMVEKEMENIHRNIPQTRAFEGGPITTVEIKKELKGMKNRKAPGWDNTTVEHMKYASDVCIETLRWILNAIVSTKDIPGQFKKGLIRTIPKPGKDQAIKDCNRWITLISVFLKSLEKIMLSRKKEWLSRSHVIDELQGAGQNKCSSLHTSMVLQEVI